MRDGKQDWRRMRRARLCLKIIIGGGVLLAGLLYCLQAARAGWLKRQGELITLRTGPAYLWNWTVSPRLILACLAGGAFLALAAWGAHAGRGGVRSPWPRRLAIWAALMTTGTLALMQVLDLPSLEPFFLLLLAVLSALAAWLLTRGQSAAAEGQPLARLEDWVRRAGGGRALPWVAALAGGAVMLASWRWVFHGQAIVTDSQSQIAQALLMLRGHWRLEVSQPLRDVICFPYSIAAVPSYSQYPPGYILPLLPVLGLGLPAQALDLPVAALTAALTVALARRVAGRGAAVAALLLLLGSPFFICLSGSGMNHSFVAALLAGAALCFIPAGPVRGAGARRRLAFIGGLCLGWAAMTRPVTGLAHGLVWGSVWALLLGRAGARLRAGAPIYRPDRTPAALVRQALWAAAGAALPAAIFLYYNSRTTGHPFLMGYQVSNPALHRLGFHGGAMPYTPADALHRLAANICSLNFCLFGWAVGSWVLAGVWWLRTRLARGERALAALILLQGGLYAAYQFHDLFMGPRFLYELLPACAVLGGVALASLARRRDWRGGLLWLVLALLTVGSAVYAVQFWDGKYTAITGRHQRVEAFVRARQPFREPTVIVLPSVEEGEMIGRFFDPGRVWFVTRETEPAARALPELQGYRWIRATF